MYEQFSKIWDRWKQLRSEALMHEVQDQQPTWFIDMNLFRDLEENGVQLLALVCLFSIKNTDWPWITSVFLKMYKLGRIKNTVVFLIDLMSLDNLFTCNKVIVLPQTGLTSCSFVRSLFALSEQWLMTTSVEGFVSYGSTLAAVVLDRNKVTWTLFWPNTGWILRRGFGSVGLDPKWFSNFFCRKWHLCPSVMWNVA